MIDIRKHKNFCIMPWTHLYKDTDQTIKLCCADRGTPIGDLTKDNYAAIRNNSEFKKLRQAFLRDERLPRCKECWDREDAGIVSLRTEHTKSAVENNWFFTNTSDYNITYFDFRTSNLCNLGCKICNPHFSTVLATAWDKTGLLEVNNYTEGKDYYLNYNKKRIKFDSIDILSEDLNMIYFAGGEPIIAEEHWSILDKLVENKMFNITLFYNTNFTNLKYKDKDIVDYWKKFDKVILSLSLDGIEKSFDYWRTGGKWNDIVKNLDYVKSVIDQGNSNIMIGVTSATGWMNFREVFRLHRFLVDNEYIRTDSTAAQTFTLQPVFGPLGASFTNTPPTLRNEMLELADEYQEWANDTFKNNIVDYITGIKKLINQRGFEFIRFKDWVDQNKRLDKYFDVKLKDVYTFNTPGFTDALLKFYNDLDNPPKAFLNTI